MGHGGGYARPLSHPTVAWLVVVRAASGDGCMCAQGLQEIAGRNAMSHPSRKLVQEDTDKGCPEPHLTSGGSGTQPVAPVLHVFSQELNISEVGSPVVAQATHTVSARANDRVSYIHSHSMQLELHLASVGSNSGMSMAPAATSIMSAAPCPESHPG